MRETRIGCRTGGRDIENERKSGSVIGREIYLGNIE